ncbi:hypothetical protein [Halorubrum sp. SY-15]|uniref:hypothetical protein n=1 Tax=Halorubrum sp. SY-15 TaxID=3402277 RepID=UPI003EB82C27
MSDTDGRTEACGRCAMSTVVDAVDGEEDRDPFGDARIEVDEAAIRRVSPAGILADAKRWLNDAVRRLTYGR